MKKPLSIIIVFLLAYHCFGQEKEQPKSAFTYSVGLSYNQIWLQSNLYGTDEYGVSSSPFNWGITPCFIMAKGRFVLSFGINFSSCARKKEAFTEKPYYYHDKWQEASLASTVGFRVTGEHSLISVVPFLGFDLSYLINYEKTESYDSRTWHYNTNQLDARDYHFHVINGSTVSTVLSFPFGLGLNGGINVSYPIAKHFDIGLSYNIKFKIIKGIRSDNNPHYPKITSPVFYHNASIGVSYRFN